MFRVPVFGVFQRGFSDARDVERRTGLPALGLIPEAPPGLARLHMSPPALVVMAPSSPFAAAVRRLHAALFERTAYPNATVVALTSALPGDGKTTCAFSLARQSAVLGFRTVLLDCDLRRPALTAQFAQPPRAGLLEVVERTSSLDEALLTDTLTPLRLVPASRPDAEIGTAIVRDLLGKTEMHDLVEALRARFDHVYLDTPPVLAVADTLRLAAFSDAILVLSRWRKTPARAVGLALRKLDRTPARLVGVALTRGPERSAPTALERWTAMIWNAVLRLDDRYAGTVSRRVAIALIPPATVLFSNLAFCTPI